MTDYGKWICDECAKANGGCWPEGHVATFHNGICSWCRQEKGVTAPNDWGYPKWNGGPTTPPPDNKEVGSL